jgi:hypothetical protein
MIEALADPSPGARAGLDGFRLQPHECQVLPVQFVVAGKRCFR